MKRLLLSAAFLLLAAALPAQIAPKIVRARVADIDLLAYPSGIPEVVTIVGALPAGPAFAAEGRPAVPELTCLLLSHGTAKHDQFAIADQLERVGAKVEFAADGQTVSVHAKCLKKDLPLVIGLIAEQLREPAFASEEFEKVRTEFIGGQRRLLEETDERALQAFRRAIFPAGHPNRGATSEELIASAEKAGLDEIRAFHAAHYGPARFTLVAVGDVDAARLSAEVAKSFAGWRGGVDYLRAPRADRSAPAPGVDVVVADKSSVSIVWGQPSGLRANDADFPALSVATAALGNGFTSRLLGTVRDQEGLTYGIGARLDEDIFTAGEWRIRGSFAPALLEKGVASTRRELLAWHERGLTAKELADNKSKLAGQFQVSLATTDGIAAAILETVQSGLELSWLDRYPQILDALTLEQVNAAIRKYLAPEQMVLVRVGTLPSSAP